MRVGLIDADVKYYASFGLNIDLMKISSYYYDKKDIVSFIEYGDDINKYSKIYYRSDLDNNYVPNEILKFHDVNIGGRAFNLELEDSFEEAIPDTKIYENFFNRIIKNKKVYQERRNILLNSNHIKLSKNNTILDYKKFIIPSTRTVFLYEKDLCKIPEYYEILKELSYKTAKTKKSINNKYPILLKNESDFKKWSELKTGRYYLKYNIPIDNEELFYYYVKIFSKTNKSKTYFVCFEKNKKYSEQDVCNIFKKIIKMELFCRSNDYNFLLKNESFFEKEEYNTFFNLLILWCKLANNYSFLNFLRTNYFDYLNKIQFLFKNDRELLMVSKREK